jgi:hypothetical protein
MFTHLLTILAIIGVVQSVNVVEFEQPARGAHFRSLESIPVKYRLQSNTHRGPVRLIVRCNNFIVEDYGSDLPAGVTEMFSAPFRIVDTSDCVIRAHDNESNVLGESAVFKISSGQLPGETVDYRSQPSYGQLTLLGYGSKGARNLQGQDRNDFYEFKKSVTGNGMTMAPFRRLVNINEARSMSSVVAVSSKVDVSSAFVTPVIFDSMRDQFQVGRDAYNDFVVPARGTNNPGTSRKAFRISCSRQNPTDCSVYAAGFDSKFPINFHDT